MLISFHRLKTLFMFMYIYFWLEYKGTPLICSTFILLNVDNMRVTMLIVLEITKNDSKFHSK
jgi:hypothetical protein